MYQIILGLDGKYHCWGRLQDGTERWVETDLDAAVKSMKQFAQVMNGAKIKKKDIQFLREAAVTESKLVLWQPGK